MVDVRQWIHVVWLLFFAVWMIWGVRAKRAVRHQSALSRFRQAAVIMAAFWILFSPSLSTGPLGWRLLQQSATTQFLAVLLTLMGLGVAIWARLHLGGNWSATVTVKEDHRLVQTGPYAIVRHPIYTGMSISALGLAVLNGDLRSVVGVGVMLLGWCMKFELEEEFMTQQFGENYLKYKRRVKAIIPFVW
jgi:protein-S-isoprenylcysteine O-methyltransferase Ste14